MPRPNTKVAQLQGTALAEVWNEQVPVGTEVILIGDFGERTETRTRTAAWTLGHGAAVVSLEGFSGGWALERVIPKVQELAVAYANRHEPKAPALHDDIRLV